MNCHPNRGYSLEHFVECRRRSAKLRGVPKMEIQATKPGYGENLGLQTVGGKYHTQIRREASKQGQRFRGVQVVTMQVPHTGASKGNGLGQNFLAPAKPIPNASDCCLDESGRTVMPKDIAELFPPASLAWQDSGGYHGHRLNLAQPGEGRSQLDAQSGGRQDHHIQAVSCALGGETMAQLKRPGPFAGVNQEYTRVKILMNRSSPTTRVSLPLRARVRSDAVLEGVIILHPSRKPRF